ncbi:DoxX family protein [Pseudodesulfovibrio sediminis]|uniref:Methylamine utilization protein MauE n=1 Tax=Pseudodesulfovibrio sediminis TaxID=2810563 RepID=A0ABN6EUA4_9BACT|nr:MauE/DoxX family redox-associated membrane protein [Pseudodesulfovibrio sediminis]BCS88631.1 methylamine utilization protein MauE [Pseudodesulfovibrio sediminis]
MYDFLTGKHAYFAIRLIMGVLFIYAGVIKLTNPGGFAMTINLYGVVTWRMSTILAYVIPLIEVITGLCVVLDIKGALGVLVVQLLGFMCILLYALHIGLEADCGCFGTPRSTTNDPVGPLEAFIRDVCMLGACILLYWQRRKGGHVPRSATSLFSRS